MIRYVEHKKFESNARSMALEAGTALHEVFAFVRVVTLAQQLSDQGKDKEFINKFMDHNGIRLFGAKRWDDIVQLSPENEDIITRTKHDAINVLETGGFHDDMYDKRRTLTNLEEAALYYIDRWDWKPRVWSRDYNDPCSDVGIEIAFDIVVECEGVAPFRFTGKLDGIRERPNGLRIEDNKTASRLNDAWEQSFDTSHQLTGYCAAASVFTGQQVRNAEAIGLAIPVPRSEFSGYMRASVTRGDHSFTRWLWWMLHTVGEIRNYIGRPLDAPMFTHSCNRYFRPCTFVPLCAADDDERARIYDEFIIQEWSPLHSVGDTEGEG
jgi:hypothetical protein